MGRRLNGADLGDRCRPGRRDSSKREVEGSNPSGGTNHPHCHPLSPRGRSDKRACGTLAAMQRPPASAYAAAVGMTVAFGLSFVATKYALRGFEPLLLALLRFTLAGGILWVIWRLRPARAGRPRRSSAGWRSWASSRSPSTSASRTWASRAPAPAGRDPHRHHPDLRRRPQRVHACASATRRGSGPASLLSFAGVVALVARGGGAGGGSLTGNLLVLAASLSRRRVQHPGPAPAREPLGALRHHVPEPLRGAVHGAAGAGRGVVVGVPPADAAGGRRRRSTSCSSARSLAYLLLNYAFRFIAGEQGERVRQPDAGGRPSAAPTCCWASASRAGQARGGGRGGGGRVADEQRERAAEPAQKSIGRMRSRSSAATMPRPPPGSCAASCASASRASACEPGRARG